MIKYLTHNNIDKTRWDECIRRSFNGNIYAWSWYLDIVHPQWEALIENNYERVMPLTGNRKFGINYLFQPFFTQQLGIFSTSQLTEDIVLNFVNAIPKKYRLTEIRLNAYNKVNYGIDYFKKHRNIELDLIYNYQTIYNNYSSNTKKNLKKANKNILYLNRDVNPEVVINLFRSNKGKDVKHWKDKEYQRLLTLINTAIEKECCFVYGVSDENNDTIAAAVFMVSHDRITFLFSGNDKNNKDKNAWTFLIDSVIKEFCEMPLTFDFEGSDNEGLARFYKGFGGKEVYYPEIKRNNFRGILKFAYQLMAKD